MSPTDGQSDCRGAGAALIATEAFLIGFGPLPSALGLRW